MPKTCTLSLLHSTVSLINMVLYSSINEDIKSPWSLTRSAKQSRLNNMSGWFSWNIPIAYSFYNILNVMHINNALPFIQTNSFRWGIFMWHSDTKLPWKCFRFFSKKQFHNFIFNSENSKIIIYTCECLSSCFNFPGISCSCTPVR